MGRISDPFSFLGSVSLYKLCHLPNELKVKISIQVSLTPEPVLYLIADCQLMAKLIMQSKFSDHKHFAFLVIYHAGWLNYR